MHAEGLAFDDEPFSKEAQESFSKSMEYIVRTTKKINKKYTPKKYRKRIAMNEQLLKQISDELKGVKEEIAGIKTDVFEIKLEQQKTNERLTSIESKQQIIYEQTGKLTEYHSETMSHLEQLATKDDLDSFDKKISQHEREIFKIKNRA